jgi:dephospho-CoA kinase
MSIKLKKKINRPKTLIIGLVGLPGSGKTSTAKILKDKGFKNVVLSSFIKKVLQKKGLKINRKNLQDMGDQLRKKKGADILARLALKKIKKERLKKSVIDGIRNLKEIKRLKQEKNFYLLGMTATPDRRYKRLLQNSKDDKIKSWDDFVYYEIRENAGLNNKTGQQNYQAFLQARNYIDNNAGFKDLKKKVEEFLQKII